MRFQITKYNNFCTIEKKAKPEYTSNGRLGFQIYFDFYSGFSTKVLKYVCLFGRFFGFG